MSRKIFKKSFSTQNVPGFKWDKSWPSLFLSSRDIKQKSQKNLWNDLFDFLIFFRNKKLLAFMVWVCRIWNVTSLCMVWVLRNCLRLIGKLSPNLNLDVHYNHCKSAPPHPGQLYHNHHQQQQYKLFINNTI